MGHSACASSKSDHVRRLPKPTEGLSCQSTSLLPERTSRQSPLCSLSLSSTASILAPCPAPPQPAHALVIGILTISLLLGPYSDGLLSVSSLLGRSSQPLCLIFLTALSPPDFRGIICFFLSTPRGGDTWLCLSAWLVLLENNSPGAH